MMTDSPPSLWTKVHRQLVGRYGHDRIGINGLFRDAGWKRVRVPFVLFNAEGTPTALVALHPVTGPDHCRLAEVARRWKAKLHIIGHEEDGTAPTA